MGRASEVACTLFALLACASCASSPQCPARTWLNTTVESHRAQLEGIRDHYLTLVDINSVPVAARAGVIEWVDKEIARLRAERQEGDEVWYFREEKCSGCKWYREGYALVRGCRIVDDVTLTDDM